ncbi:MAG: hypothetical protein AAFY88_07260, partial [Acidobacteriota bacterium]
MIRPLRPVLASLLLLLAAGVATSIALAEAESTSESTSESGKDTEPTPRQLAERIFDLANPDA